MYFSVSPNKKKWSFSVPLYGLMMVTSGKNRRPLLQVDDLPRHLCSLSSQTVPPGGQRRWKNQPWAAQDAYKSE